MKIGLEDFAENIVVDTVSFSPIISGVQHLDAISKATSIATSLTGNFRILFLDHPIFATIFPDG